MDQASNLRKMVKSRKTEAKTLFTFDKSNAPRVISVTSGKGGVGKTNFVANLARAFAEMKKKVLIIDADLGLANMDIIFGVRPSYHIGHVLNGEKELEDILLFPDERIGILPAGSGRSELTELSEGQKLALLGEFENFDMDFDIVLLDTGAGISKNVLYFNVAADECILLVSLEPTSITDAYAMIKLMSTEHGVKHFKLVVSMAGSLKDAKKVFLALNQAVGRFLTDVVLEYSGFIPFDPLLRKAVLERKTVLTAYPGAESSKAIRKLAKALIESPRRYESEGNIKFFFKRFMALSPEA